MPRSINCLDTSRLGKCLTALLACTMLNGCVQNLAKPEDYSGYLSDYSQLQPVTLESGAQVLRWSSPELLQGNYRGVLVRPTEFYPEPQVQDQIGHQALQAIAAYIDTQVRSAIADQGFRLVDQPAENTLIVESAFTSINVTSEGLEARDLIPARLVFTGLEVAIGEGDYNVSLFHEFRIRDSDSGRVLARGVRKGDNITLANKREQLDLKHVKALLDRWRIDIAEGFSRLGETIR